MKKILFLITTLRGGGAEKVLVDLVNALPKEKYEITLQTIMDVGVYKERIDKDIRYKTIVKNPGTWISKARLRLLYKVLPPQYTYNRYIKDEYDAEVAFLEGMPTRLIANSTSKRARKYAWVHINLKTMFGSLCDYKNFAENLECYKKFNHIACVSEAVKQGFLERFGTDCNDVQAVYNLIPDEEIQHKGAEATDPYPHDYPILVSCGRFFEQKGFDRLLRIHQRLQVEGLHHYLWLIGDGPLRRDFEKYILDNGLDNTVKLWGFQENPYKYMSKADLFVCSSIEEGYSTVISESAVLGIPIISTDVSGAREPLDHPRCYKVVENNEESLYEAIKSVLLNPQELLEAKKVTESNAKYLTKRETLEKILKFLEE